MNPQKLIPVDKITISPRNPRRIDRNDPSLDELAESIQAVGLLHPVLVRKVQKGEYELLAGQRRYLASLKAEMTEIAATIAELTDDEALEVMITENLQRADLTLLEEGRAVASLLETRDVQTASGILAKSVSWVRRRAKLASLTPAWLTMLEGTLVDQGDQMEQAQQLRAAMTAGHLELLAHFPADTQDRILSDILKNKWRLQQLSLRYFRSMLADFTRQLGNVPWPLDSIEYGAACIDCQTRSDREPDLFNGVGHALGEDNVKNGLDANAQCLNPDCFKAKYADFIDAQVRAAAKKTKQDVIKVANGYSSDRNAPKADFNGWQIKEAKKGDPGAVPAVKVDGPDAGKLTWVITPKKNEAERDVTYEPEATIEEQRLFHQIESARTFLEGLTECPVSLRQPVYLLAAVAVYGCHISRKNAEGEHEDATADYFAQLTQAPTDDMLVSMIWTEIRRRMLQDLYTTKPQNLDMEYDEPKLALVLEVLGLDRQDFLDKAYAAFPDPKPAKAKKGGAK